MFEIVSYLNWTLWERYFFLGGGGVLNYKNVLLHEKNKIQALCFLEWCLLHTVWRKSDFNGIKVDKRVCSYDNKCSRYALPFLLIILGAANE